MRLRHWLQLSLTDGIGPVLSRRIIERAGDLGAACQASASLLQTVEGIGTAKGSRIAAALKEAGQRLDDEIARAEALGARIICPDDEDLYPPLLRTIPDPPIVLYVRGDLQPRDMNAIAIVGSRKCSYYGREQAERLSASLAGVGVTIVSGGARGIDSAAHRGAMAHPQGRTIAVIGSGLDVPYPPENDTLFDTIAAGRGAVISEFPLGTQPNRENFPRRNRVVSGMSRGVLVVEADEKSGALITARQAGVEHGRPVMALPGKIDNPLSAGPHKLIRDGATLVTSVVEILEALEPLSHSAAAAEAMELFPEPSAEAEVVAKAVDAAAGKTTPSVERPVGAGNGVSLSPQQRELIEALGTDSANVDTLVERTSLSAQVVLQELTFLSLKGVVRRIDGQTYACRRK
jgi:DNA processing protein